jgi:hypothetical protein
MPTCPCPVSGPDADVAQHRNQRDIANRKCILAFRHIAPPTDAVPEIREMPKLPARR